MDHSNKPSRKRIRKSLMVGAVACGLSFLCGIDSKSRAEEISSWTWGPIHNPYVFKKKITLEEDAAIGSPDVLLLPPDQGFYAYKMVYAQGGTDHKGRLGMAVSHDGVTWERVTRNGTILSPVPDGWDSHFLDTPALLKHNGIWYLWYYGAKSNDTVGASIGLAVSSDGLHFKRAQTAPVLGHGRKGEWDELWVESPAVVHDGHDFVMYYTGVAADWVPRVGRATSHDGIHWIKEKENPVLGAGVDNGWDSYAAAVPDVIYKDKEWQMFYAGVSRQNVASGYLSPQIGLATSRDGITWTRYLQNPVIDTALTGNHPASPYNPAVVWDVARKRYLLWYEGGWGFGLATAPEKK